MIKIHEKRHQIILYLALYDNSIGYRLVNKAIPECPCEVVALGVVVGGGPTKQNV